MLKPFGWFLYSLISNSMFEDLVAHKLLEEYEIKERAEKKFNRI